MGNSKKIFGSMAATIAIAFALVLLYSSAGSQNGRYLKAFAQINIDATQARAKIVGKGELNSTKKIATTTDENEAYPGLKEMLQQAAMEDGRVIMTAVNEAWAMPNSLLDLFLESFRVGEKIEHLLRHVIVVAMDPKAYQRCKSLHPHCYFLKVKGVDFTDEKAYKSKDYLKLMWNRNKFQRRILELGYNFLFTDVDIVWFRDPFLHISPTANIMISSDVFFGNPDDLNNWANGGLIYVKSSKKTIEFYKHWYEARKKYPGEHEQYVFDQIKKELAPQVGVMVKFLSTSHAGGLCQPMMNFNTLCTFHANCREGLPIKLQELRNVLEDWKKYKAQ